MLSFQSIPPGILHLCFVIVARDNDNDGGANYGVEEEDDDMATDGGAN